MTMNSEDKGYKANFSERELSVVIENNKEEAEEIISDKNATKDFIAKVCKKLENIPIIGICFKEVPVLCELVIDNVSGKYTEIPLASILTIVAALIYFLSPVDLIPDVIPVVGYVDDAFVLNFAIMAIKNDLEKYKEWKTETIN